MKFKVDKRLKKNRKNVLYARVDDVVHEKMKSLADKNNIKVNDLFIQMINHCLNNMEE